jgi:PAS domain S-box-containing protein
MAIRDLETDRYVEVNDRCLALVGYAREEVVGRSPFEIGWMSDGDREENRRILLVAEGVKERELRLRRKDGCSIICVYSSHPVRIAGRPCLLSCSLDITERKQAELRDAEQLAELRRWQALMIQRSDRNQELKREVNDLLHRLGESPRHPSQVAQPVDTTMTIEALPAERSRRAMLDTLEDQAQAEAARRESEGKYRVLFESMAEGMALHELVCDAADGRPVDYRIIECNPGFEKHTGLSAVAARGQLASRFFGADPAPYLDIYAEVVRTGTARTFETYYPPLNRHFFISAFVPSPGRFATIFVDISASKEAERLLKQKMENLERFQAVAVNRELQMIELKDEINALLRKSGAPEKYRIVG